MAGKKFIRGTLEDMSIDYVSLDHLIVKLQALKDKYAKEGWNNLKLEVVHGYYDSYGVELTGERLETDAEYQYRLQWEANAQVMDKEARRKTYEQLKKEFDPK